MTSGGGGSSTGAGASVTTKHQQNTLIPNGGGGTAQRGPQDALDILLGKNKLPNKSDNNQMRSSSTQPSVMSKGGERETTGSTKTPNPLPPTLAKEKWKDQKLC